jgi:hypothetical protein
MLHRLLRGLILITGAVIVCLFPPAGYGGAGKQGGRIIIVNGSTAELLQGYDQWMLSHKKVLDSLRKSPAETNMSRVSPAPAQLSGKAIFKSQPPSNSPYYPLLVRTPSIDLYAPSGISILYSTSAAGNPGKIPVLVDHGLPRTGVSVGEFRPTLKEALQMFPPLRQFENHLSGYVLFALTCSEPRCDGQRQAIRRLQTLPRLRRLSVIEVNLH